MIDTREASGKIADTVFPHITDYKRRDTLLHLLEDFADTLRAEWQSQCAPAPSESPSPAAVTDLINRLHAMTRRNPASRTSLTDAEQIVTLKEAATALARLAELETMEQRANIEFVLCKGNDEAVQEVVERILTGSDAKKVGE